MSMDDIDTANAALLEADGLPEYIAPPSRNGHHRTAQPDRALPHSEEAERAVLASIITTPALMADIAPMLTPADYYTEPARIVYSRMVRMHQAGEPILHTLLIDRLRAVGELERIGGMAYLLELSAEGQPKGYAMHFAGEVAKHARRRRLMRRAADILERAADGDPDVLAAELAESLTIAPTITPVSIGRMITDHPHQHDPVVDGLLRRGETANIIAAPKAGKSWLAYGLAFSVVTGQPWLGQFPCRTGRVLLIDNELHPPTIASRMAYVGRTLGLAPEEWQDEIGVLSLRGRLMDLHGIAAIVERLEAGRYSLVILDAWYRSIPAGTSENDNASVMGLYNTIDHAAARANAAWVNIHHSTKGSQTDRAITDVGAGAGSQSRAADAHIVLRPHEEEGVVVLEAVVRSFPPVAPLALRWEHPLWRPATDVDPALLRGRLTRADQRKADADKAGLDAILDALLKADGPLTLRKAMAATGMGQQRLAKLCHRLATDGHITIGEATYHGQTTTTYAIA